jgi:hypothetical protein
MWAHGEENKVNNALKYVNLPNTTYLTQGLTFNVLRCAEVLDSTLIELNKKTGIVDKIAAWNREGNSRRAPLMFPEEARIILQVRQNLTKGDLLFSVLVLEAKTERAPGVHLIMHSPTFDIPMRVEIALRAFINGGPHLEGTYTVYLHTLLADDGQEFVYYGITKRGWNNRFTEHLGLALGEASRRLFPAKMNELMCARAQHIRGENRINPMLSGVITTVCAVGLDEDSAMDAEEYLVDKYSLSGKHSSGLNMIPGGREGIRALRRLSIGSEASLIESDEREELLEEYLKVHPLFGRPNPGVAAAWDDPAYAEAVICGRENRLSAGQVREIRYMAAMGCSVDQIKASTGASDNGQVSRVLSGRSYSRIT